MKGPFDITKIIFNTPDKWAEVSNREKQKNFFILNRRFAIQFPLQANLLSRSGINNIEVMNFWKRFLSTKYKKTPYWMYVKGEKKRKEQKEKKLNITEKHIREYANFYILDIKSVKDAIEFYPKQMQKEIKDLEKMQKK